MGGMFFAATVNVIVFAVGISGESTTTGPSMRAGKHTSMSDSQFVLYL